MEKIWLKSYPKSVPEDVDVDAFKSLVDVFETSCKTFSDKPAFSNMGKTITYKELDRLSASFAAFLQKNLGLKKGDRIAIQMPNLLQYPICLFGALRAGLIVVNTNPLYTPREMKHQFNDSGAKAIVILANFAHQLDEIIDDTPVEHVIVTELGDRLGLVKGTLINAVVKYVKKMVPSYKIPGAISLNTALLKGALQTFDPPKIDSMDTAFLQYTGGTTGVSKGAVLAHRNMVANMMQIGSWLGAVSIGSGDIIITALPLYHIFSLTVNCMAFLKQGGHNVLITNPKDIPAFVKELGRYPFNVFTGVNTLFNALVNNQDFQELDFSTLRITVGGGMAVQTSVAKKWQEITGTPLVEGYGLTESSPVLTCNRIDGFERLGSIGIPLPSTLVTVRDEEGKDLPQGEEGEICGKGPQIMQGYWQRPKETEATMWPDGWLKTGDIGLMEDDGYFRIVDRKKDMILVSGFNVYPNEIEEVVASHPGILEVAAVGVPDERSGEAVKIFVVRKNSALTVNTIKEYCREHLTGYKNPKYVEFREELPKTNVGKILRRSLREEGSSGNG
jgi:long-chain acyl-CoA synthetase